ncbi:MAG: ABC transporter ATP-binding protein [Planctomycetota bacterium]
MLDLRAVEFGYPEGGFKLSLPAWSLDAGARAAVIGPSGCGKTTLLHLIAGILRPSSGAIRIDDTELTALDEAARRSFRVRRLGLVFQEFELLDYLDVLDNVLLPCRLHPDLPLDAAARERGASLAAQVGLGDKLHRPIRRLSQGERQRIALCRALIAEPALILADEPTGNLDPDNKLRALDLLEQFASASGAALVVATHDHALLPRFDAVIDFQELLG